jgi:hypothetical protein
LEGLDRLTEVIACLRAEKHSRLPERPSRQDDVSDPTVDVVNSALVATHERAKARRKRRGLRSPLSPGERQAAIHD